MLDVIKKMFKFYFGWMRCSIFGHRWKSKKMFSVHLVICESCGILEEFVEPKPPRKKEDAED